MCAWCCAAVGDASIKLWDIETQRCTETLEGHLSDVMSSSINEEGLLVTGSCDATTKVRIAPENIPSVLYIVAATPWHGSLVLAPWKISLMALENKFVTYVSS